MLSFNLTGRYDFQPVTIGIGDEIDAHSLVLIADTAHFLVMGVSGFKIIGPECQVEFVVPQVIRFLPVFKPGQVQLVRGLSLVALVDDGKVRFFNPAYFFQVQGLFIEGQALA